MNIASLAGLIPSPTLAPYAATKSGVVALTNALRVEGEALGVRASVVCPGFVDTAIFDSAIGVRVDKQDLIEKSGLSLMPANEAAHEILLGVEKNEGVIVFPASARALWRLVRFSPRLSTLLHRRTMARLRTLRRSG